MKLYKLEPIKNWEPWYDKTFGLVIRATNEEEARKEAMNHSGDEGAALWLDPTLTKCEELNQDGIPWLILQNFASA
jgi:hypothetical protein